MVFQIPYHVIMISPYDHLMISWYLIMIPSYDHMDVSWYHDIMDPIIWSSIWWHIRIQFLAKISEKIPKNRQFLTTLGFSRKSRKPHFSSIFRDFHENPEKPEKTRKTRKTDFPPQLNFFQILTSKNCLSPLVQTKNGELKPLLGHMVYGEGASDLFLGSGTQETTRKNASKKWPGHGWEALI